MSNLDFVESDMINVSEIAMSEDKNEFGYRSFTMGDIEFSRDRYFVQLDWTEGSYVMGIDSFLATTARSFQFSFFVGSFVYDGFFGWTNHYGRVEFFIGRDDPAYVKAGLVKRYILDTEKALEGLRLMLNDWISPQAVPFYEPLDTQSSIGSKQENGPDVAELGATRIMAERILGYKGDAEPNTESKSSKIDDCKNVIYSPPEIFAEPGFEDELVAYDISEHLACQKPTWCPGVCSMVQDSGVCMTSEGFDLNLWHRNDRFEWFVQLSNEIRWDVEDGENGEKRARIIMKAGDVCAMPHDIRHRGYTPNRAWLLVWENFSPSVHEKVISGETPLLAESLNFD